MSSAAETTQVAPPAGNVHRHTFFYETALTGNLNNTATSPPIALNGPVSYVKHHNLVEIGTTVNLGGGDQYQQAILNQFLNMYKYYRYAKCTCTFKPFYNFAPITTSWVVGYNQSASAPVPTGLYTINGAGQISASRIRKVLVNTDNTDWSNVSTLSYVKILQVMTNTIRGTTIESFGWSYIPKLMTPMLQDFQTQGTPSQLRKVESGGQWLPTKYFTPGTSIPAGFNPVQMMGFDFIIYDPAGDSSLYLSPDTFGWLEFVIEMEFSIIDDVKWIGTPPQDITDPGSYLITAGTTVSNSGSAGGSA